MNFLQCLALCTLIGCVACDFEVLVLHTSDMHARFDPIDDQDNLVSGQNSSTPFYGGFARLKYALNAAKEEAKQKGVPTIFLNAGDTFQGTSFYTMLKQDVVAGLLPLLDIEAMTFGNHEFDDGPAVLQDYLSKISTRVVISNLDFSNEPRLRDLPNLSKAHTIEVNGKQIGIVGYLTSLTKDQADVGNTTFQDEVESVKREARRLKDEGVKIIIALGHSGFDVDKLVARDVPDISLVIGGHTNTFLYNPPDKPPSNNAAEGPYPFMVTQPSGRKVPIVTAYAYTKYLGKLWAKFDDDGNFISARNESNPQLLDSSIPIDEAVQRKVNQWRSKINEKILTVVGQNNVYLDGWKASCKILECNLGNFIADAFIDYVAEKYRGPHGWTDAAVAVLQSGSIRLARNPDKVYENMTYEDILAFLPYRTALYKVRIHGSAIKSALEFSVSGYIYKYDKEVPNTFFQVSGLHITYDMRNPPGKRVTKIDIRCANCSVPVYSPLDDKKIYTVIMTKYLADGGDKFTMISEDAQSKEMIVSDDGISALTDTDALARFMTKYKVVYPEISGRVTILNPERATGANLGISRFQTRLWLLLTALALPFKFL